MPCHAEQFNNFEKNAHSKWQQLRQKTHIQSGSIAQYRVTSRWVVQIRGILAVLRDCQHSSSSSSLMFVTFVACVLADICEK
mmetsp:Transcript_13167/g.28809  ORF Transcript_13167/g.28809 Transcript_13167/m.28809 type:complete len:82 (-) Transcript_13167:1269-1514(-)